MHAAGKGLSGKRVFVVLSQCKDRADCGTEDSRWVTGRLGDHFPAGSLKTRLFSSHYFIFKKSRKSSIPILCYHAHFLGGWGTENEIVFPSPGAGSQQLPTCVSAYYKEEKRRDTFHLLGSKQSSVYVPLEFRLRKRKPWSDPQNNAQRARGRLDNGAVHSNGAKGLVPEGQSGLGRRHYSMPEPSCAPWLASFFSKPNCVFTSIVTKVSGPLEAGESSFRHGWRADCRGVGGHLPWGVSPFSQHPSCLTVIASEECKAPPCCRDRL